MSSPEDRMKHSRRRKEKQKKDRMRSPIAKEMITSGKFSQRIVQDKRGRHHDLATMDNATLVKLIQELDE